MKDNLDTNAMYLGAFFSDCTVPTGLTEEEIRICLALYPRRDALSKHLTIRREKRLRPQWQELFDEDFFALESAREAFSRVYGEAAFGMPAEAIAGLLSCSQAATYTCLPLPSELIQSPMTRESFARGIALLTAKMDALEKEGL